LTVDDTGFQATPMTFAGFAFMWTGVRSTYGVKQGKVCFQVKVIVRSAMSCQSILLVVSVIVANSSVIFVLI